MTGEPIRPCPRPPKREAKARRPLLRKKYMKKRKPKRLSRAGSNPAYLEWVRTQPCTVTGCRSSLIHAHHAIHRSQGGKDDVAIPMCLHHHATWHQATGIFAGLSRLERFAWSQRAISETQAAYKARAE